MVCVNESNIVGEEAQLGIRKQRLLQRKQERVGMVLQRLLEEVLQVEAGGPLCEAKEVSVPVALRTVQVITKVLTHHNEFHLLAADRVHDGWRVGDRQLSLIDNNLEVDRPLGLHPVPF